MICREKARGAKASGRSDLKADTHSKPEREHCGAARTRLPEQSAAGLEHRAAAVQVAAQEVEAPTDAAGAEATTVVVRAGTVIALFGND
jgi:hypothetical protein